MSVPVLTAVTGVWEAPLVAGLERSGTDLQVVRRCADLAELLSAAGAGLGSAAVVSADLHRLDRDAVSRLADCGVAVVGLFEPGAVAAEGHLRALGVLHRVPADAPPAAVAAAVTTAVAQLREVARQTAAGGPDARVGPHGPPPAPPDGPPGADPPGGQDDGAPSPGDGRSAIEHGTGRLVAVWGPAGAPGRTTVAVTLSAELAALTGSALLVDADTYGASVAQSLGLLDESAGLAAAVRAANLGALDAARLARLAPVVLPGLRVLTGLPRPSRWPELRSSGLDVVWERARDVARWTVIDTGFCLESDEELSYDIATPRRNQATLSALEAADVVVAVGSADPIGLQRLVRGLGELAELWPGRVPVVVVMRVRTGAVGPEPGRRVAEALDRFAGVRDPVLVPEDREVCDAAMLAGRALTEHAPSSAAREVLAGLAADLAGVTPPARRRRWPAWGRPRQARAGTAVPTVVR